MPLRLSRQRAHPGRQQVRVAGWPSVGPLCRVEWRVRRRIERSRDLPSIALSLLDELAGARGLIVAVLHGFQVRAFTATDVVGLLVRRRLRRGRAPAGRDGGARGY